MGVVAPGEKKCLKLSNLTGKCK